MGNNTQAVAVAGTLETEQGQLAQLLGASKRGRNILIVLDTVLERENWLKLSNVEILRHYLLAQRNPDPKNVYLLVQCQINAGKTALFSGSEIKSIRMEMTLDQGSTTLANLNGSYEYNERNGRLTVVFHEDIEVITEDTREYGEDEN